MFLESYSKPFSDRAIVNREYEFIVAQLLYSGYYLFYRKIFA